MNTYFKTREIAAISISAALWGVLNGIFSPIFFRMTGLPFLCDLIGFSILVIATWWIKKFGAIIAIGIIATIINFAIGGNIFFLGFTAASIIFDLSTRLIGYNFLFKKPAFTVVNLILISILSAAVAGYLIGTFFMAGPALINAGGVLGWAGLHAAGGVIGGAIGTFLILGLTSRQVLANSQIQRPEKGEN